MDDDASIQLMIDVLLVNCDRQT